MALLSQKYCLLSIVLLIIFDLTYSVNDDTPTEGHRHSRVSGRIVKLYSGPKPNPIECLGEGFQGDALDCSVFYRCIKASNGKYSVYRFQCGPGTVYDPDTEICNHPRRTKRFECAGLSSDKIISSTETYKENEIEGWHSENHEVPSPISTKLPNGNNDLLNTIFTLKPNKFESSYITTSYPWATTSKEVYDETKMDSYVSSWNIPTSAFTIASPLTTYVTRQPNAFNDNRCTTDGFMGDSEDCRKFYRCVNNQRGGYIRYEFSCSEPTIWDDATQGCNHRWAVKHRRCGKHNSYDENSTSSVDKSKNSEQTKNTQETQTLYGSEAAHLQTQISTSSALQNHTEISFGERLSTEIPKINKNESKISYGSSTSLSPIHTGFGNKATQINQDYSNKSRYTQTSQFSPTSTPTANSTHVVMDSNPNKCQKDGFIGDSNNCKKFYRCVSNDRGGFNRHEFSCSEGTLWDEKLEACNHAWAVKECGGKILSQNIQPNVEPLTNYTTYDYYSTTSSSFYNNEIDEKGYENQINLQEYDQPKLPSQNSTLPNVTTESSKLYETDCKSSGFFGHEYNCSTFYRCVENGNGRYTKYEYKCGDGTVWDPEIESCNHAWAVRGGCQNGAQKENINIVTSSENLIITTVALIQTTTQKNIPIIDTGNGNTYHTEMVSPFTTEMATTEQISVKGNKCKSAGFMGDNVDCKKFYRCVDNGEGNYIRHEFNCGEGTVWDPQIEACNHAWAVKKCGSSSDKNSSNNINLATTSSTTFLVGEEGSDADYGYITHKDNDRNENTPKTTTQSTKTSTVMLDKNKGNECQTNGFIGDTKDCKVFYRCVENSDGGFIRYVFSCGDGTVWDPKITACNHESNVERCGGGTSVQENEIPAIQNTRPTTVSTNSEMTTQSSAPYTTISSSTNVSSSVSDIHIQCMANGYFGDKQNCKKFYRCVEDGKGSFIRYEFSCGDGTVWDPKIEGCNHVREVESCGAYASPVAESVSTSHPVISKDEETDNNYVTHNNQEISSSSESSSTIQSSITISDSMQCVREGFMGDINDCKKFYRCVNDGKGTFIRYEFSCGKGTVWDSMINACNHINSAKTSCRSVSTQNSITSVSSSTSSTSVTQTTEKPEVSSSTDECTSEGFYANLNDCKKFFRCVGDGQGGFTKYDFTCGDGTVWVQDIQACDHDSDSSHCSKDAVTSTTISATPSSTTPSLSSQEKPITSTSTSTTSSNIMIETETPSKENDGNIGQISSKPSSSNEKLCESEGFYPDYNDCTRYYRCVNDGDGGYHKYDFTCSEGTAWDTDVLSCNHIGIVMRCQNSNQAETQTKPTMQDETVPGSSSTEGFSLESTSSESNQDYCEESGYFGNSKDCKKFYRCVDDGKGGFTKYDFTCGDGTIWDQDITACNHPQDVSNPSCETEVTSSTTTKSTTTKTTMGSESSKTTTKGPSSTDSSTQPSSTENSTQSSQGVSTQKPDTNYTCTEAGFYADPYDCKKFYRCVDWNGDGTIFSIYHFDCGEGTIWDPALQTCNHEDSVYPPRDCSGSQSHNETNTDNTTTAGTTAQQEETTESTTTQMTTPKDTTERTTTEQSTTTVQTSTQQSSTSEQTSTTEQNTTQQTTTEQSTTKQSTTEQSTTQQSTTQQSTTTQSTTTLEQTTNQQSSTTQQSTTPEQSTTTTTEQTTTTELTSTTTEQSTTIGETTNTTTEATSSESTTNTAEQTTKTEQTTTQESNNEQTSENQSSTTELSTTTQGSSEGSLTTESGQDTTTEQVSTDKDCPETDDDQYLYVCPTGFKRHPKYCNLFYQCTEDDESHEVKVAVFTCPNNTIYDESKTQCVEDQKADKKCDGQIAQRRRVKRLDTSYKEPITVNKDKYSCITQGHFPFEKNEECSSVLFKCEVTKSGKLRGLVYQCPEGYLYWSISRRCEPVTAMTDCKRSMSNWNGRYELPTERKNVARKK